jgi:chaperonin cofactor prefoldin
VANTLSKLSDNRRCFRKIGDTLVEKDLGSIKKDLNIEIANIKQTLDVVYRTMNQQEMILNEYEEKYNAAFLPSIQKFQKQEEQKDKKNEGGVLA